MFRNALAHVQRNPKALLIFVVIVAAYFALRVVVEEAIIGALDAETLEQSDKVYLIVSGIVTAIVIAIAQTIAFTILGRDIDRPFWKVEEGLPTFLRFCSFWFTLNYINTAVFLIAVMSPVSDDARVSIEVLRSVLELLIVPFGATVMFYGNTTRAELGQAFHTMILQLPLFFLVGFFGLIFQSIQITLQAELIEIHSMTLPIIGAIGAYMDCFIFAYTWEICKRNREQEENADDDLDF
jgi:hypothetical protein